MSKVLDAHRIVLLGASGQVGSALRALAPDYLSTAAESLVAPTRRELNLSDAAAVQAYLLLHQPSIIINAAAYTAVDKAQTDTAAAQALNALLPQQLAHYCAAHGVMLLHYSTDYVFDGAGGAAYRELDATHPQSVYGQSKLAGEQAIIASGAQALILRLSWVFGEVGQNFVKTILRLASTQTRLRVVADQVGRPTSAHMAAQVSWALLQSYQDPAWRLQHAGQLTHPVVHCAGVGELSWHGFACSILQMAAAQGVTLQASAAEIEPITTAQYPTAAPRPAYSVLNTDKLRALLAPQLELTSWANDLPPVIQAFHSQRDTQAQPSKASHEY